MPKWKTDDFKRRRKIGDDPNNTTWANSTTGFGHKIMAAQGWTPGSYLGATNAAHASHYSAANASHIRVALKEDNLGLGAKRGQAEGQEFGLGTFQDLLGRLNGKSEVAIARDQEVRADLGRKLYAEQRWGPSRFVRGGYLVGDKIEEEQTSLPLESATTINISQPEVGHSKTVNKTANESARNEEAVNSPESEENATPKKQKKKHKEKKDRESKDDRRQRKLEKRAQKEAKRLQEAIPGISAAPHGQSETDITSTETSDIEPAVVKAVIEKASNPQVAASLLSSIAINPASRMAVRQRYIKQKRMASMDPQAMREVYHLIIQIVMIEANCRRF